MAREQNWGAGAVVGGQELKWEMESGRDHVSLVVMNRTLLILSLSEDWSNPPHSFQGLLGLPHEIQMGPGRRETEGDCWVVMGIIRQGRFLAWFRVEVLVVEEIGSTFWEMISL